MRFYTQWVKFSSVLLTSLFFLNACATKEYAQTKSIILSIKTPPLKFSDQAYLRYDEKSLQIELFSAGVAIEKFEIENLICTYASCMSKGHFNAKYLSSAYEDNILDHILRGEIIFEGKGYIQTKEGFKQIIEEIEKYKILYIVKNNSVYFRDKYNNILIKVTHFN